MICGRYYLGTDHIEEVEAIRKSVFDEELNLLEWSCVDQIDEMAIHAVVYTDMERTDYAAVGRLYRTEKESEFWIDRIAVRPEQRKNGYGDFIVRMLVDKGLLMGASCVYVASPLSMSSFFEKIGFHKSDSSKQTEIKTDFIVMEIRQNQICRGCQKK